MDTVLTLLRLSPHVYCTVYKSLVIRLGSNMSHLVDLCVDAYLVLTYLLILGLNFFRGERKQEEEEQNFAS